LWNSPASSNPVGAWSPVTLGSIGLQSAAPDRTVMDLVCEPFAPPSDEIEDEDEDEGGDTKWHGETFIPSPLFGLLRTLQFPPCNPPPCYNCRAICCNTTCCSASATKCCGGRCCSLSHCCGANCCNGLCCNVPGGCCEPVGSKCCGNYCCPATLPKCCGNNLCCGALEKCCGPLCCSPTQVCLSDGGAYACCTPGDTLCNGQCCPPGNICCMDVCSPKGACCDFVSGSCEETNQTCCEAQNKTYQGNGSQCNPSDICRPKCENCHPVIAVYYECGHFPDNPLGPCGLTSCITNTIISASCDSFPYRLGPAKCNTFNTGIDGEVIQVLYILPIPFPNCQTSNPGGFHTWQQIYWGCGTTCIQDIPYQVRCDTGPCGGIIADEIPPQLRGMRKSCTGCP
ncbi:MAG: hypothetical protein AABZ47_04710, partial [Planctomycetota bacterium]